MLYIADEYTPIDIGVLREGMHIDYDIYGQYNGEFVLLCKNTILTPELLLKFKKMTAPAYQIYIPNERFNILVKQNLAVHRSRRDASLHTGYTQTKAETVTMLNRITADDRIPDEVTNSIAQSVHTQLDTVDVSSIIQSINSVRDIDEYLHTHSINVAILNGLIGKWLKFNADDINALVRIGLLHDIGKLRIPSEILNKPAKLTPEEFEIVKKHPVYSCEILVNSGVTDKRILSGTLHHHEKVNGLGYPHGLTMERINDYAKITSISDVYDAMVAKRVYKDSHSPFQILAWFAEGCYSDLDIKYVRVFLDCMTEEFNGKNVLLSNGAMAEVLYVNPNNLEFPIVRVDGQVTQTIPELSCVSMQIGSLDSI